jgi:NAD(P)-dependent dehydrogenase (short-subunit alcohol dehydrogenase family)
MGLLDGKVAIITGAGGGLGEAYARLFAQEGAAVVVNDLGGARDGSGDGSVSAAQKVVNDILAQGGRAVANGDDVSTLAGGENILKAALDAFGQVDILVCNAGILRDKSFANTSEADWDLVVKVHLKGTYCCTMPVWKWLKDNGRPGVIVMTSSTSGLYGNFGQSNYGAAKMALVGLMQTLSIEGAKNDIRVNCLAPTAHTRMTEDLGARLPLELLGPDTVTPGLLHLVSEDAPSRCILTAGAGGFERAYVTLTQGIRAVGEDAPEQVAARFAEISDRTGEIVPEMGAAQGMIELTKAQQALA